MALVSENHVNLIVVVNGFGTVLARIFYVYPKHVYISEVKLLACTALFTVLAI